MSALNRFPGTYLIAISLLSFTQDGVSWKHSSSWFLLFESTHTLAIVSYVTRPKHVRCSDRSTGRTGHHTEKPHVVGRVASRYVPMAAPSRRRPRQSCMQLSVMLVIPPGLFG